MKLLLTQSFLNVHERRAIETLLGAAVSGIYWDELYRMESRDPDFPIILQNIVTKAKQHSLEVAFQHLKDHYGYVSQVFRYVPEHGAYARA